MASNFYDKHLPDYVDLDNVTKTAPGYRFGIRENDGGIGVYMGPISDNPDGKTFYSAFLNVNEAKELLSSLQEAIDRAEPKNTRRILHRNRVKEAYRGRSKTIA
jgi:ArsR family metal-binding transcriptional regulator